MRNWPYPRSVQDCVTSFSLVSLIGNFMNFRFKRVLSERFRTWNKLALALEKSLVKKWILLKNLKKDWKLPRMSSLILYVYPA